MKIAFFVFFSFILLSCSQKDELHRIVGSTMGTTYSVKYIGPQNIKEKLVIKIETILEDLNNSMSTYRPGSELSRINSSRSVNWLPISKSLEYVLSSALKLSEQSDGAYDVTLGPLVNLWGFGPDGIRKVPSEKKITRALKRSGYKKLLLKDGELKKKHPELYIDLSSIAKGYGVDLIGEYLTAMGLESYLVEIGGELRARGAKAEGPWRVAIQTPGLDSQAVQYVLELKEQAVATSGDYRNYFTQDKKKYSHTIDARTGRPVQNSLVSVTVISNESCMQADGVATMLMAMGKDATIEFTKKNKVIAYIIWRDGNKFQVYKSPGFVEIFGA